MTGANCDNVRSDHQIEQFPARVARRATLAFFATVVAASLMPPIAAMARMRQDRLEIESGGQRHAFEIEVAESNEEKALGLMFRTELAESSGMLFSNATPQESSMWMRNTYISLDMLFIRADGIVHRIEKRTEPQSERIISSGGPVLAVLELAGGTADKLGLKPGDRVHHPLFRIGAGR